jgi:hypothetical protein
MKTKLLLLVALLSLSSCYYYRVIPEIAYNVQTIEQFEKSGKILVLHRGEDAWHMYNVKQVDGRIHAGISIQLSYLVDYLDPSEKGLNTFSKPKAPDVVNSVHLYTADTTFNALDTVISIHPGSIYKVQSYEYARAASRASIIVPIVFIPVIGLVTASLVALSQMSVTVTM